MKKKVKTEVLSSAKTDGSDFNYCGWVDMKKIKGKRRIIAIHEELGREGGMIWSPNWNSNGNLEQCMASIGRKWPKLYARVRELCPAEKLPPISTVQHNAKKREFDLLDDQIKRMEAELRKLKSKRSKLRHQLGIPLRTRRTKKKGGIVR